MAKLYFRYGTVNSAKTMNLLAVAHNYKKQGKNIIAMKPKIDTRTDDRIYSRVGIELTADYLIDEKSDITKYVLGLLDGSGNTDTNTIHCILVDESQFLSNANIMEFRYIASYLEIPIICYGLRTNYLNELFEGSASLFKMADSFEEIKNTCHYCNKKGVFNLKIKHDGPSDGSIDLGFEDKYIPTCFKHYFENCAR